MEINSKMLGIVKSILLESTLNDIFKNINPTDTITIKTFDGSKHVYEVESNMVNRIIMKDLAKNGGGKYVMDKNSLNDNDLTIWKYDGDASGNDFKGDEINLKVDKMGVTNRKTGGFEEIEIDDGSDELERELNHQEFINDIPKFNQILKDLEINDVLAITTETFIDDESDDTMVNTLFLKLNGIKNNIIRFEFEDIQGGAEGEITNTMKEVSNILKGKYVQIGGKSGFFKKTDDKVSIDLTYSENNKNYSIRLKGVIDVSNDNITNDIDYDKSDKKFSKKEIQQDLLNDKTFQNMMSKKPDLLDLVLGTDTSPVGLMNLKNLVNKYKVKSSYLSKGNLIKYKLLSPTIRTGDMRYKILNRDGYYYEGKVTDENTIKMGNRGRGHWEINLKKEIKTNTYESQVIFCKTDGSCKELTNKAIIKILTND